MKSIQFLLSPKVFIKCTRNSTWLQARREGLESFLSHLLARVEPVAIFLKQGVRVVSHEVFRRIQYDNGSESYKGACTSLLWASSCFSFGILMVLRLICEVRSSVTTLQWTTCQRENMQNGDCCDCTIHRVILGKQLQVHIAACLSERCGGFDRWQMPPSDLWIGT